MCSHNSVCEGIGSGSERVRLALGVDGSRKDRDGTSRRSREVATRSRERDAGFFAFVGIRCLIGNVAGFHASACFFALRRLF